MATSASTRTSPASEYRHAFDLKSAALSARATLEAALERRETRGCHNRSDHPHQDPAQQVNLVWSPTTGITRESIPAIPDEISALMTEVSTDGKPPNNAPPRLAEQSH